MSRDHERAVSAGTAGRRLFHRLRTEGDTPARQAAAFGIGTFIGCSPLFGLHLQLCLAAGWLLGLNRLKLYLAANISNPFVAPVLLFGEVQAGRWLRTGLLHPFSLDAFRAFNVWQFGADLILGSIVVGLVLGAAAAATTYALVRRAGSPRAEAELVEAAVDRYLASGILAWEFANGKIRSDPVYLEVLRQGLLPAEGTLLDLGCGRGFMLTLLAAARERWMSGAWPAAWPPAPSRLALRGIELRSRIAASARLALGDDGTVEEADVSRVGLPRSDAVLLFDVLHMMPWAAQDDLLERIAGSLEPDGVLLVREADRAGGWRFRAVHVANWWKGVFEGTLRRRLYFRSAGEWTRRLEALGFAVRCVSLRDRTPFANILIEARRQGASTHLSVPPNAPDRSPRTGST
ncbi:MAG: DUF2062 domain-containing protein [Acidobacteria bacterium]|nr:DUF2062 domain-containing protein [Acidobacteriota bacterium]